MTPVSCVRFRNLLFRIFCQSDVDTINLHDAFFGPDVQHFRLRHVVVGGRGYERGRERVEARGRGEGVEEFECERVDLDLFGEEDDKV